MADVSVAEKNLLSGEARKLAEVTAKNWREHLVLLSQVDNEVLEVNPYVSIPLKLEKGKSSPLGLFAQAMLENPVLPQKGQVGEFWSGHGRSVILSRVIFNDDQGRLYRDIDLKGIGFIGQTPDILGRETKIYNVRKDEEGKHWGLLDRDVAFTDYDISEEFLAAGIRTDRVLAIIELKELIFNRKKFAVETFRRTGRIDEDFCPVVEVRGFGTKLRVADFDSKTLESRLAVEDAEKLVAEELGRENLTFGEYVEWFHKTLAANVALMHKNGWLHRGLHPHNVTLDCRIVDLDSVEQLTTEEQRLEDLERAVWTFFSLAGTKGNPADLYKHPLKKQFKERYDVVFPPEERERYFGQLTS